MVSAERAVAVWGGDVVLARRQHYFTQEYGAERVLHLPSLRRADLAIVNLECVAAHAGQQGIDKGEGGPFYFRARPEMLRVLALSGVHAVATANNHSGDYGSEALLEQLTWLERLGIGFAGTGRDRDAAFSPAACRAGQFNVALFSIDTTQRRFAASKERPGTAYLPLSRPEMWRSVLEPRIEEARAWAHVVLVAVHWGPNFVHTPRDAARSVGRLLIDIGSDAVLGSSAHVLQGLEIYRDRPIVYDAGNLLFDALLRTPYDSGLFSMELSANGVERLTFLPVAGGSGWSDERQGEDAVAASSRYAAKCRQLGTQLALEGDGRAAIELKPVARTSPDAELVPAVQPNLAALESPGELPAIWQPVDVPADASIAPTPIGPLVLLGVRVSPTVIRTREMLWVETFWRTDAPVEDDLRIDLRATPVRRSRMRPWGEGMDHDPCDWLLPTSRWRVGRIYRDLYGLRPPYLKDWENVELELSVSVVSRKITYPPVRTGTTIQLDVPDELLHRTGPTTGMTAKAPSSSPQTSGPPSRLQNGLDVIERQIAPSEMRPSSTTGTSTWTADVLQAATTGDWLVRPPQGWGVNSLAFSSGTRGLPPAMFVAYSSADRARHEASTSYAARNWDRHAVLPRIATDGSFGGAIVARGVPGLPASFPLLQVDDPLRTAMNLGILARNHFGGPVIAVTGTVGKSTSVAMLSRMIGSAAALTTAENYNTRVGALLTLSNLRPDHKAAVIEVAQSALWMKRGPITRLVRPTASLLTAIGLSQTDRRVRSIEDAAKWKSRIFDGLTATGVAVFPDYLPCFDFVHAEARKHASRVVLFGYSEAAEVRIVSVHPQRFSSAVELQTPIRSYRLVVPAPSRGMAENAVGAFAVLYALGFDLDAAALALSEFSSEEGRMQRVEVPLPRGGTAELVDDSWNATVASMTNAISFLGSQDPGPGGRRIGVLGRIVHLGEMAARLHADLAQPILDNRFDLIVTHGAEMTFLRAALPEGILGPHFDDAHTLVDFLAQTIAPGDIVLIKGSRRDSDFGSVGKLLRQRCSGD